MSLPASPEAADFIFLPLSLSLGAGELSELRDFPATLHLASSNRF